MSSGFSILEHTADVGFEAQAPDPAALFREAANALLYIAIDDTSIAGRETRALDIAGDDYPSLLVNFLEEILYLFDARVFAPRSCEISSITPRRLIGGLRGEPHVPDRHRWKLIVKAVTYHDLDVAPRADGWHARVFLDV